MIRKITSSNGWRQIEIYNTDGTLQRSEIYRHQLLNWFFKRRRKLRITWS